MHTPGFSFGHDAGNVRGAVQDTGIDYPVGLDDEYAVWGAFASHYWPALYFADAQGRIRHHHVGEGEYQQSEMIIQRLLAEAGFRGAGHDLVSPEARGSGAPADWSHLRSPENYTGYVRAENFASPGDLIPGRPHVYEAPDCCGSTTGPCPETGRPGTRPPRRTPPAGRSPAASAPGT